MRLLSFDDLKPQKGITYCRTHLRRMMEAGRFPRAIALSDARIAWDEEEVDAWLSELKRKRDTASAEVRDAAA